MLSDVESSGVHELLLDPARWTPLQLPDTEGRMFVFQDDNARISHESGRCVITIPTFSLKHDSEQMLDNGKVLLIFDKALAISNEGGLDVQSTISVEPHGTYTGDYRDGVASLTLFDPRSGYVFDWFVTPDRAYALHERLAVEAVEAQETFSHVVDDPFQESVTNGRRKCRVRLDWACGHVEWFLDGKRQYLVRVGADRPSSINVGLGIFTLRPVGPNGSTCVVGQGLTGNWYDLKVTRF